ncbi:MAG TPA: TerB family tellurite resistance protein [Candidatus Polarisedimenticolia bacterium]|nr:TerB family tellurite resistance protein [Candidatus Polarisedimenticolia bacterium]
MSILRFLGLDADAAAAGAPDRRVAPTAETETVRKIVQALDRIEPERARYVAAFAYILSRVARADLTISDVETAAMERLVMQVGGLPEDQAILVVQMAKTQSRLFGGTENYLVTREFNRLATREEKLSLLRCLFAVSAADESISTVEDNEIRRVSRELQLTHDDFIEARSRYRRYLAVLRDGPPRP